MGLQVGEVSKPRQHPSQALRAIASRSVLPAIDAVTVGERHRRDLGDLDALAANIKDPGLLHPIVVRRDGTLIAGEQRQVGLPRRRGTAASLGHPGLPAEARTVTIAETHGVRVVKQ